MPARSIGIAEVEKNTFNPDSLKLADALETGKKAGVDVEIIGVGLFGNQPTTPPFQNLQKIIYGFR